MCFLFWREEERKEARKEEGKTSKIERKTSKVWGKTFEVQGKTKTTTILHTFWLRERCEEGQME